MALRLSYRSGARFRDDVMVVKPHTESGMGRDLRIPYAKIGIGGVVPQAILARTSLDLRDTLSAKAFVGE